MLCFGVWPEQKYLSLNEESRRSIMKRLLVLALVLAFVGAVQAGDTILVTNWSTNSVTSMNTDGTGQNTWSAGSTAGAFGIAANNAGNVLVTGYSGGVQEYTTAGTLVAASAIGGVSVGTPQGLSVGTDGTIYMSENSAYRFAKYNASWNTMGWAGPMYDNFLAKDALTADGYTPTYAYPSDIKVNNATGDIYAVVGFQYPGYSTGVVLKTSVNGWGATVTQSAFFSKGTDSFCGLAIDKNGNVWVADDDTDAIYKLNSAGQITQTVSTGGNNDPRGLAFDSAGNLYAVENRTNKLDKWTAASGYTSMSTIATWTGVQGVNFIAIVPEPATMVLLGLGALTLLRKKK